MTKHGVSLETSTGQVTVGKKVVSIEAIPCRILYVMMVMAGCFLNALEIIGLAKLQGISTKKLEGHANDLIETIRPAEIRSRPGFGWSFFGLGQPLPGGTLFTHGDLTLYPRGKRAMAGNEELDLSYPEYGLLHLLMQHKGFFLGSAHVKHYLLSYGYDGDIEALAATLMGKLSEYNDRCLDCQPVFPYRISTLEEGPSVASADRFPDRSSIFQVGELRLDMSNFRFLVGTRQISLTPTETKLMETLMRSPDRVFSRQELLVALERVAGSARPDQHLIEVHLSNVRRKLRGAGAVIRTCRGFGYYLTSRA